MKESGFFLSNVSHRLAGSHLRVQPFGSFPVSPCGVPRKVCVTEEEDGMWILEGDRAGGLSRFAKRNERREYSERFKPRG